MSRSPASLSDIGKIARRFLSGRGAEVERVRGMSLAEWVEHVGAGPRLERLLRAMGVGLFAVEDYSNASAMECFEFLSRVLTRGYAMGYPVGGWTAVLDALRRPIEDNSRAELRLRSRVEEIEIENGRAVGVRLAGGKRLSAKTMVWAAPVQELPGVLPQGALDEPVKQKLLHVRSTYGVNIDFALAKPVTRERRCIVTLDPPSLGWFVSNVESSVAPLGCQLLTVFSPVSPEKWPDREYRKTRYTALRETYMEMFPGLEQNLLWERTLDTLVGAARPDTGQTRAQRPGPAVPGVENLLLIGDSTSGAGFGGEIAADSALRAFDLIVKKG